MKCGKYASSSLEALFSFTELIIVRIGNGSTARNEMTTIPQLIFWGSISDTFDRNAITIKIPTINAISDIPKGFLMNDDHEGLLPQLVHLQVKFAFLYFF